MIRHVAYLVPQYPQLSESFVRDEFGAVSERLSAVLVAVQRPRGGAVHDPAVRYADSVRRPSLGATWRLWQDTAARGRPYDRRQLGCRSAWAAVRLAARIADCVRDAPPQVWHAHFAGMAQHTAALACCSGVPYTVMVHGTDLRYRPRYPLTDAALAGANAVLCASDHNATMLTERFGVPAERVHCIPLGLDLTRFKPGATPRDNHVVAVGRLEAVKGFDVLIDAVARLRQRGGVVTVDLWGQGSAHGALQDQVRRLDVGDVVRLRGPIAHETLPAELAGAAAVVVPSRAEGFGLVAAEALACGTPVIASGVGGLPEVVDSSCGMLIEPDDVDALAHALQSWLGNAARAARARVAARERAVARFDRRRQIGALLAVWERCHREGRPQPRPAGLALPIQVREA